MSLRSLTGDVVVQASYTYDVFGNRIGMTVTQDGVTTTRTYPSATPIGAKR